MIIKIITRRAFAGRSSLFSVPLILCVLFFAGIPATPVFGREVKLEDDFLLVAFDSHTGALTRFENKDAHWIIERRPELGVAFRLFAPLPERRWNPVFIGNNGPDDAALFTLPKQKQPEAVVKKISAREIRIRWKNPVAETGGVVPLTLTADVTLTNGVLTFDTTLENDSPLTIETIDYPYFGDFNPPSRDTTNMAVWLMRRGKPDDFVSDEIYPHFNNKKGYWGVFWPTKIMDSEQSPFCLIQAPDEGFYVQMGGGKESPYRLQYIFEQHPGVVSSVTQMVPKEDEIAGAPVHLEFRMCHFIFQKPHSTTKLVPIVLRCYRGDWRVGVDIYKPSAQR